MKIPVNDAINAGDWLECSYKINGILTIDSIDMSEFLFKLKLLSFEKIFSSAVNYPEEMEDEGMLWLLGIDVVNLSRTKMYGYMIQSHVFLHDQDDFIFDASRDEHLTIHSTFAKKNWPLALFNVE